MTVLILTPVLLVGGTERHTQLLARVLCEAGHAVEVVCYYEHDPAMVAAVEATGAKVTLLSLRRGAGHLYLLKTLTPMIRQAAPDAVHVVYVAPGFVPVLAARLVSARRLFATVHQPATPYGWKARLLLRTAARLCTAFFCVSQSAERSWFGDSKEWTQEEDLATRRHWTVYAGVDREAIATKASKEGPGLRKKLGLEGHPVVGVVGRLRHEKGQDILLGAMVKVVAVMPEARLLVVGDGPDRDALPAQARTLGLENIIVWAGQATPEDVHGYYGAMDVLVVPSRFEGFGLVAVEAMAASVQVIGTDVEGLREILATAPNCALVPSCDPQALAEAIQGALIACSGGRQGGEMIRDNALKRFSLQSFKATQEALLKY